MPKIRTYDSAKDSVTPSDKGVTALANAAEDMGRSAARIAEMETRSASALGGAINRAGEAAAMSYDRFVVQPEITAGAALLAVRADNLTREWNQSAASTDPNDAGVALRFREKSMEPALSKFEEGFQTEDGRVWARKQAQQLREHFIVKTTADTATRAGLAITSNMNVLQNTYTNMVSNDPTSFGIVEKLVRDAVTKSVETAPNLAPEFAGRAVTTMTDQVMKNLAQAAVQGMARANPAGARAALESGRFSKYITGEEKTILLNYAQAQENINKTAASAERTQEKQRRTDAVNTEASRLMSAEMSVGEDGTILPTAAFFKGAMKLVEQEPEYGPKMAENLVRFGQSMEKEANREEKVTTDPKVYSDFMARKELPPTDPRALTLADVLQARVERKLSVGDVRVWTDWVNADVKNPQKRADMQELHRFLAAVKPQLDRSTLLKDDALGSRRYLEFMQYATDQFKTLRATKVPVEQILRSDGQFSLWRDIPRFAMKSTDVIENLPSKIGTGTSEIPFGPRDTFQERFGAASSGLWKPGMSMDELARKLNGGK